jgi:hypothetical protein
VVNYRNTLNQRQYVLYHTECPSEGGIAGCGISLQYHPLLWWVALRKLEKNTTSTFTNEIAELSKIFA